MSVREVWSYLKSNWLTRKDQVDSLALFISSLIMLIFTLLWSLDDALPITFMSFFFVRSWLYKKYKKRGLKKRDENKKGV